jgi:hypothetical protein
VTKLTTVASVIIVRSVADLPACRAEMRLPQLSLPPGSALGSLDIELDGADEEDELDISEDDELEAAEEELEASEDEALDSDDD